MIENPNDDDKEKIDVKEDTEPQESWRPLGSSALLFKKKNIHATHHDTP